MQSAPSSFWEWMASLGSGERFSLVSVSVLAIGFVITIIAIMIYSMHKNRLEVALKRELLERGMSSEEIATVIRATPAKCGRGEIRST